LLLAFTAWIGNEAVSVLAQEPARVLEIERYPDEPLQLVDLRIGTKSVKEDIKQKFKDPQSKWAIDNVMFKECGSVRIYSGTAASCCTPIRQSRASGCPLISPTCLLG